MSQEQKSGRKKGSPNAFSLWMQRKLNARTTAKLRRKGGKYLGMDMLILHTTGRRTGQPRETPITWFPDDDGWLVVASGGGKRDPDWYANLMAHPEQASVEVHGSAAVPVTAHLLAGEDRAQAWQRITGQQPRYAKYQKKSAREYPVVRLARQ